MPYQIFKRNDPVNPFVIVNDESLDSSTTSIFLVGRRKENYGQPQNQNFLWLLENFANSNPPADAVLGQGWFNTTDEKLYVCIDETTQTFEKVSNPLVDNTPPTVSLTEGDLWFNPSEEKLYVWNGTTWSLVGPESTVPLTVREEHYLSRLTSDSTTSQLWLDGVSSQVLNIQNNTSWLFEITLVARRTDSAGERRSWKISGMIDNTANNVTLDNPPAQENLSQTATASGWGADVVADNSAKSLRVNVTGETGKDIEWNSVVRLTKVS